jgi:hypothetical protein
MLFKGNNKLVQIYRSFSITGNYGRRIVALSRHKFVTGATLLQLMLTSLEWQTLEQRRRISRLVMMYKIQHQLLDIDRDLYLIPGDKDREVAGFSYLFHFDQLPIGPIKIVCLQQEKWISGGKTFDILCLFCRSYELICTCILLVYDYESTFFSYFIFYF